MWSNTHQKATANGPKQKKNVVCYWLLLLLFLASVEFRRIRFHPQLNYCIYLYIVYVAVKLPMKKIFYTLHIYIYVARRINPNDDDFMLNSILSPLVRFYDWQYSVRSLLAVWEIWPFWIHLPRATIFRCAAPMLIHAKMRRPKCYSAVYFTTQSIHSIHLELDIYLYCVTLLCVRMCARMWQFFTIVNFLTSTRIYGFVFVWWISFILHLIRA